MYFLCPDLHGHDWDPLDNFLSKLAYQRWVHLVLKLLPRHTSPTSLKLTSNVIMSFLNLKIKFIKKNCTIRKVKLRKNKIHY